MTYLKQVLPTEATDQQCLDLQKLTEPAFADMKAARDASENTYHDWDTYEKAQAKADASRAAVVNWLKTSGLQFSTKICDWEKIAQLLIVNTYLAGNLNCYR